MQSWRPMVQIPVRALKKKKKVCHHTTMWWCDGTLAFSLQKCDFPPNVSHSNWCASWDKASTPHMVCYSHFIFYSVLTFIFYCVRSLLNG